MSSVLPNSMEASDFILLDLFSACGLGKSFSLKEFLFVLLFFFSFPSFLLVLLHSLSFFSFFAVLKIEPRALCMLGKCSVTELHPLPLVF
jgi:hypothetical protein